NASGDGCSGSSSDSNQASIPPTIAEIRVPRPAGRTVGTPISRLWVISPGVRGSQHLWDRQQGAQETSHPRPASGSGSLGTRTGYPQTVDNCATCCYN